MSSRSAAECVTGGPVYTYLMHGCGILSDLDLHLPTVDLEEPPSMVLRRSSEPMGPRDLPDPDCVIATIWQDPPGLRYYVVRTPSGYLFHFEDVCEFEMDRDLVEVTWSVAPNHGPGIVSVLASGTLMAFRLSLARHLVLHASAVRVRGHGLALVGKSGMGKSTTATLLCAAGAELLTDDVARVDIVEDRPMLWPGCVESRLRPGAISLVSDRDRSDGRVRSTDDGRTAVALKAWDQAPVQLDAVVIPVPSRDRRELQVERLAPATALIWLSRFPRIAGWTDDEIRAREFADLADLARRVPVHIALLPWGPPFATETVSALLDELRW